MKKAVFLLLILGVLNNSYAQECRFSEGILSIENLNSNGHFDRALAKAEFLQNCKEFNPSQLVQIFKWEYKLQRNKLKRKNANTALSKATAVLNKNGLQPDLDLQLLLAENYALLKDTKGYNRIIKEIERLVLDSSFTNNYYLGRYYLSKHYSMNADHYPVERVTYMQKALELFDSTDSIPIYYRGNTLRALGNLNRSNGDFDKSADYYKRELDLYLKNYEPDHFNISICNYNLGGVYYERLEYQVALKHFLAAHKIWVKTYQSDSYRMRTLNEAIGDMYWELNNHEKALEYFNYAVSNEVEINNDTSEHTLNIADSLLHTGNYASAINYYEEAVKWRQKTYGEDHMLTGACKNFVARALRSSGNISASLDAYQEAIIILVKEFTDTSWYANPEPRMTKQSSQYLLDALMAKGELLKELFSQTNEIADLKAALATQEIAISLLEKIKNNQMSASSKVFWTNKTLSLIESSIETAMLLDQADFANMSDYNAIAFNFAERSKALLLLASLYDQEITSFANVPEKLIQKEKELKREINNYVGRIESEEKRCADVRDKMLRLYSEKLQSLQNEYDLHINEISQNYPDYYHLKYDLQVGSTEQFQKELLADGKQLISYFSGIKHTYVLSMRGDNTSIRKIENSEILDGKIELLFNLLSTQYHDSITPQQRYNQFSITASELYKTLLEPELKNNSNPAKQLLIIPDGNLAYIPFEVLLTDNYKADQNDYGGLPYMVKNYAISYSPSASIALLAMRGKSRKLNYIGFAPDYTSEIATDLRKKPAELKFNQPEVEYATQLFGGKSWTGVNVTEDLLKSKAGEAGVLHLAMHGEVENDHPLLSKLIFNNSKDEDGLLHTYEIYNLSIPAQLVILSACNTASGKLLRGEGIMSLERAFQYAGSKSLLATLWTVDDAASAEITQLFLENMKAGNSKDVALQQAKITFLANANPEHLNPFFWSSFKLTGNIAPLKSGIKTYYYGIAIGLFTMLLAIVFFRRRKRKNSINLQS